jgi:hypothetical protein
VLRSEQHIKNLGTEGSPTSVDRAAQLEVPMFLGILGGTPEHWGQYCHAYWDAWLKAGHPVDAVDLLLQFKDLLETTIGMRRRDIWNMR